VTAAADYPAGSILDHYPHSETLEMAPAAGWQSIINRTFAAANRADRTAVLAGINRGTSRILSMTIVALPSLEPLKGKVFLMIVSILIRPSRI